MKFPHHWHRKLIQPFPAAGGARGPATAVTGKCPDRTLASAGNLVKVEDVYVIGTTGDLTDADLTMMKPLQISIGRQAMGVFDLL